jgi:hypothetical protein
MLRLQIYFSSFAQFSINLFSSTLECSFRYLVIVWAAGMIFSARLCLFVYSCWFRIRKQTKIIFIYVVLSMRCVIARGKWSKVFKFGFSIISNNIHSSMLRIFNIIHDLDVNVKFKSFKFRKLYDSSWRYIICKYFLSYETSLLKIFSSFFRNIHNTIEDSFLASQSHKSNSLFWWHFWWKRLLKEKCQRRFFKADIHLACCLLC